MKNLFKNISVMISAIFLSCTLLALTGCEGKPSTEKEAQTKPVPAANDKIIVAKRAPETKRAPVTTRRETADAKRAPVTTAKTTTPSYQTARLNYATENGVPAEYKDLVNPFKAGDTLATASGRAAFATKCALCHGADGKGDSPMGKALNPPASDLTLVAATTLATDGYLFWAETEGGKVLKSSMPGFSSLPEEERWQIILYIKTGL